MEWLNVLILGIVEGVTEFLPISSTGHLILFHRWFQLTPESFQNAFDVCIQLGAILAVVVLYFRRLNPFCKKDQDGEKMTPRKRRKIVLLWARVLVAVLPAMVLGLLFDDLIDQYLFSSKVVAIALIVWGIVIILMERKVREPRFDNLEVLPYKIALGIGFFQCLAMIPGTSRSAATIIGAMVLGLSRVEAAEFSFFLAIPTMLGATLLKVAKNLGSFTSGQWLLIAFGGLVSFITAYLVIKAFMAYIKNHDFVPFGIYRIVLGLVVLLFFL